MQSLHCSQHLIDLPYYSECRILVEVNSDERELAILPKTYMDIYEIIAALDIAASEVLPDGQVILNPAGYVSISSSAVFSIKTNLSGIERPKYTALLELIGFDSTLGYIGASSYLGSFWPEGFYQTESFNLIGKDKVTAKALTARGKYGDFFSLFLGSHKEFFIEKNFIDETEALKLSDWQMKAVDGRATRIYLDDETVIDARLIEETNKNKSFLRRISPNHFGARFNFLKEQT